MVRRIPMLEHQTVVLPFLTTQNGYSTNQEQCAWFALASVFFFFFFRLLHLTILVMITSLVPMRRSSNENKSALLALCVGNSPVTGEFPHKCQWRGALVFSLICVWINSWINNREAGDLRCYRAHYDVSVMIWVKKQIRLGTNTLWEHA